MNHQPIAKDLSEGCYSRVKMLMKHTGVKANTYQQYQRWGSYVNPWRAMVAWLLNWSFWFTAFYLTGGLVLAVSLFGAAGFWAVGVRTFNYEGHAKGKEKHRAGVDYNHRDRSINQLWPGYVVGEWHNNHHLYPRSARSGFKPHQLDLAWCYIKILHWLGAVSQYKDAKKQFYKDYHQPYQRDRG